MAWNEDSAFMGEVVNHEMGHLIGGIHNSHGGTAAGGHYHEHHDEGLDIVHSEYNSQNVKEWFGSAGYRCYGKSKLLCFFLHQSQCVEHLLN